MRGCVRGSEESVGGCRGRGRKRKRREGEGEAW